MTLLACLRLSLAGIGLAIVLAAGAAGSAQSRVLSIVLTGQTLLQADLRVHSPSTISAMAPLLKGDVVFTNFESTIAASGEPNEKTPVYGMGVHVPPGGYDALMAMGFNMLSLSNNHAWDLGVPGIRNSIREARQRKLTHAGTGETVEEATAPAYLRTSRGTVALIAMASGAIRPEASATKTRPGVNELRVNNGSDGLKPNEEDAQRILQSIRDASRAADYVIVYQHNHVYGEKSWETLSSEQSPERLVPPAWIKQWAHAEVDAGADVVVFHGPPVMQGVEIYRNRLIFYSLGNFIFQLPPPRTTYNEPMVWESVVPTIEFQGKNLHSIKFQPVVLNFYGRDGDVPGQRERFLYIATRGLPAPASGEKAREILNRLAELSRAFGTKVEVKGDTAEIRLKR